MNNVFLSVVIPSYNETENLERGVLAQVRDYLARQSYAWEVIISDDDSPDPRSKQLASEFCAKNPGFTFLENQHGGKPIALWGGIQKATGEIILFTDMDQSTPIAELDKLLPKFKDGYDVVIGSRGLERKNFSPIRKLASTIFRTFRRAVLLAEIIDTQAGFKMMKTTVAREIFPLLAVVKNHGRGVRGWTVTAWDVEMLEAVKERDYKIAEVPISWADRDESVAKAEERQQGKFVKESIDMLKEVFRVKFNSLRGQYRK
ncbi:glycosyltransferase [Candidatus Microgenomates bacterium]|nr:glycosyltransferase [Candidatus Microgenomates bacterium]